MTRSKIIIVYQNHGSQAFCGDLSGDKGESEKPKARLHYINLYSASALDPATFASNSSSRADIEGNY